LGSGDGGNSFGGAQSAVLSFIGDWTTAARMASLKSG
jgi:hypothetical protein